MKSFALLALTAGLISLTTANATIRRVNNGTNTSAAYSTLQAAHNAAAVGDTIQVEGSFNTYAGFVATKKVVVIGPGYFLDQNTGLQASALSASIGTIEFSTGSAGSSVMGLNLSGTIVYIRVPNITLRRNYNFGVYLSGTLTDIVISQNYKVSMIGYYTSGYPYYTTTPYTVTGMTIANNHFNGTGLNIPSGWALNTIIQNNVFDNASLSVSGVFVVNNILTGSGYCSGDYNTVYNNMCEGSQFSSINSSTSTFGNNVLNQASATIFQGITGNTTDGQWRLKTGSPAIGTGTNGVDMGMYGNGSPYVLSGIPPVPTVYFNNTPVSGTTTAPLNVTVKVRSNN